MGSEMKLRDVIIVLGTAVIGSSCAKSVPFDYSELLAGRVYDFSKVVLYRGLWSNGAEGCTITAKAPPFWEIFNDKFCDGAVDEYLWGDGYRRYIKARYGNEKEFERLFDPKFRELKDSLDGCDD